MDLMVLKILIKLNSSRLKKSINSTEEFLRLVSSEQAEYHNIILS
jgi:hypothetical protein